MTLPTVSANVSVFGDIGHLIAFCQLEQAVAGLKLIQMPNRRCSNSTCWLGGGQRMASVFAGFARPGDRRGGSGRDEPEGGGGPVWGERSSAIKWVQRFERSGSRAATKMGGYLRPSLSRIGSFSKRSGARERTSRCKRSATGCSPNAG